MDPSAPLTASTFFSRFGTFDDLSRGFPCLIVFVSLSLSLSQLSPHACAHFDIDFQLTQLPGKMVMEPTGGMVGALEDVSKIWFARICRTHIGCSQAAGKRWWGAGL